MTLPAPVSGASETTDYGVRVTAPSSVAAGSDASVIVAVGNNGPWTAHHVKLTVTTSDCGSVKGVQLVPDANHHWPACSVLPCTIDELMPGVGPQYKLVLPVAADASGKVSLAVSVSADENPTGPDYYGAVTTIPVAVGPAGGAAAATTPAATSPAATAKAAGGSFADLAGRWDMVAPSGSVGTIVIHTDGSYNYNGSAGGMITRSGDKLSFAGALAAWQTATYKAAAGTIEFYWTDSAGAKYYFAFARG